MKIRILEEVESDPGSDFHFILSEYVVRVARSAEHCGKCAFKAV